METALTTTTEKNLPPSLLLNEDALTKAIQSQDHEFIQQVFLTHQKGMGIDKAVATKAPTFHDVTNFFSEKATLFWLRFHIAETFAFLGIWDKASVYQIRETAELILQHEIFGQLTLDEFLCFLKRFKMGAYGKIYQSARPNPQEFLQCLQPFWNELCNARGRYEEKARLERFARSKNAPDNMTYTEWLEYKRKRGEEVNNTTNPLEQTAKT